MGLDVHESSGNTGGSGAALAGARASAREALAAIADYRSGRIDGLHACRSIVNDEPLREIVPIGLLLGFIGVESQFGADAEDDATSSRTPDELAELRAERDEVLTEVSDELHASCTALAAHLERWQRENPPPAVG
jgi:hypothetical protein